MVGPKIGIFAGPSLGILLSAKAKAERGGISAESDDKDLFPSTDFGFVVGAGLTVPLGVVDVLVDARYNLGLSTLDKDGNAKAYNRVFSVNAGIEF